MIAFSFAIFAVLRHVCNNYFFSNRVQYLVSLVELNRDSFVFLFLHIGAQCFNDLLHVLRIRKNFQTSESRVRKHVFVRQRLTFEYFFINLFSVQRLAMEMLMLFNIRTRPIESNKFISSLCQRVLKVCWLCLLFNN